MAATVERVDELEGEPEAVPIEHVLRRRQRMVLAVLLVLLAVAFAYDRGRAWLAAGDRADVHVLVGADALSCEGTEVTNLRLGDADDLAPRVPTADVTASMACTYDFTIANDADRTVRVEQVVFPVLGPGGGPAVEAVELAPFGVAPRPPAEPMDEDSAIDAVFDVGLTIPSGASEHLQVRLVHRPEGCSAEGSVLALVDVPTLTVGSLGRMGERRPRSTGFALRSVDGLNDCS